MQETWKVAVAAPIDAPLTYIKPAEMCLKRGQAVIVPLGGRKVAGVAIGPTSEPSEFKLKSIASLDTDRPTIPENYMSWFEWLSRYYIYPIGMVFELAFPPLKKKSGRATRKSAIVKDTEYSSGHRDLTGDQIRVIADISAKTGFATHLLHGVTGSGKTEVYIQLLEQTLAKGQQGLVLVPEISLTPQLIQRFSERFGQKVAVIHSHLTPREKTNQWWAFADGEKQILIGARSALFCPSKNLGLIILDEEHEPSFKQDESLRYHARDSAIMLGKSLNCPVLLGSATPSLETWQNCLEKKFELHEMKKRVEDRALPTVEVVDLRTERESRKGSLDQTLPFWLSETLYLALSENIDRNEQSALFLNRRGVAQSVTCTSCGKTPECPNCAVTLTLHGKSNLLCHYCDFHETLKEKCKECKTGEPKAIGVGTELIENDLKKLFPRCRVIRMDRDEVANREDLERAIETIEQGETDFIVGTQMIAKGLDFPKLTVVGLVLADVAFNLPDFRASERSFQLLTQVTGRAGRHLSDRAGRVIIQTYNPDHPSIQFSQKHDYHGFAEYELGFRRALSYPPVSRLALFKIQGLDLNRVESASQKLRHRSDLLKEKFENFQTIEVLGPAPAPLTRLRGMNRYQMLVKGPNAHLINQFCRQTIGDQSFLPPAVKVSIDIDAINLL